MNITAQIKEESAKYLATIGELIRQFEASVAQNATEFARLEEWQTVLLEREKKLEEERALIEREKEIDRERKVLLDQREKDLKAKAEKIHRLLAA
jgi:hypothetical protein